MWKSTDSICNITTHTLYDDNGHELGSVLEFTEMGFFSVNDEFCDTLDIAKQKLLDQIL